jgi:hypothetical protein
MLHLLEKLRAIGADVKKFFSLLDPPFRFIFLVLLLLTFSCLIICVFHTFWVHSPTEWRKDDIPEYPIHLPDPIADR